MIVIRWEHWSKQGRIFTTQLINLICISFASLSLFGISQENSHHPQILSDAKPRPIVTWISQMLQFSFQTITTQMKYPQLTTESVVFSLQNELHRYNEFLFKTSRRGWKQARGRGWEETRSRILPHMQITISVSVSDNRFLRQTIKCINNPSLFWQLQVSNPIK